MTSMFFVRHARPNYSWEDDRTRPLSAEGIADCQYVCNTLQNISLDYAISSPYIRSIKTIEKCAILHNLEIYFDERYREREKGKNGNNKEMFQKRWADFNFHEDGGESLLMVQQRNIEALTELLTTHQGQNILLGTHGTLLTTILNYYDNSYNCDDFLRIIDYMPYIIRLDFEGLNCINKEELLIVKKEYTGNH